MGAVANSHRALSEILTPQQHFDLLFGPYKTRGASVIWHRPPAQGGQPRTWTPHTDPEQFELSGEPAHKAHHLARSPQDVSRFAGLTDVYLTPNLFNGWRRGDLLSRLCAFFIDIDVRDGSCAVQAAQTAMDRLGAAGVPEPNIVVYSGRGAHLYFLLDKPVPAQAAPRWRAAERRLVEIAGGDLQAADACRVLRLCGTVNSHPQAQGAIVRGFLFHPKRYEFDWFCDEVLDLTRAEVREMRKEKASRKAARKAAARVTTASGAEVSHHFARLWQQRYADLVRIADHHWPRGVAPGYRNLMLFHMAVCMSWYVHPQALQAEITKVAGLYMPTYSEGEIRDRVAAILNRAEAMVKELQKPPEQRKEWRYCYRTSTLYSRFAELIEPYPELLAQLTVLLPPSLRTQRRREQVQQREQARDRVAEGRYTMSREQQRARSTEKGLRAQELHAEGLTWLQVGQQLGLTAEAARKCASRARDAAAVANTPTPLVEAPVAAVERPQAQPATVVDFPRHQAENTTPGQKRPSYMVGYARYSGFGLSVSERNDWSGVGGPGEGVNAPVDNSLRLIAGSAQQPLFPERERSARVDSASADPRLAKARALTFEQTIDALGLFAREDRDYKPRLNGSSRRYHVDSGVVREIVVTWPLWIDSRLHVGGRGAIDLAMSLLDVDFKEALARLAASAEEPYRP